MHFFPVITALSVAVIVLLALLVIACGIIAVKKKESPLAAATELKQNFVDEAKRGEAAVAGELHKLEASVLYQLHRAEGTGVVSKGTTQALVDAHVDQVKATTAAVVASTATGAIVG